MLFAKLQNLFENLDCCQRKVFNIQEDGLGNREREAAVEFWGGEVRISKIFIIFASKYEGLFQTAETFCIPLQVEYRIEPRL